MDPVSLGLAAAALLASRFGEEVATVAATNSLRAVSRLREAVVSKFGRVPEAGTAIASLDENATVQDRAAAAEWITSAAASDSGFAAELQHLIATARQDQLIEAFVAQAFDDAKQVNIRGDNAGTINIT
jgi:hypothetical protein